MHTLRPAIWPFARMRDSPRIKPGYLADKVSKIPSDIWKIHLTLHQQFLKELLSLRGFGEVWSTSPGYVGKIIESWLLEALVYIYIHIYIYVGLYLTIDVVN